MIDGGIFKKFFLQEFKLRFSFQYTDHSQIEICNEKFEIPILVAIFGDTSDDNTTENESDTRSPLMPNRKFPPSAYVSPFRFRKFLNFHLKKF